jgi:hypothetical protein
LIRDVNGGDFRLFSARQLSWRWPRTSHQDCRENNYGNRRQRPPKLFGTCTHDIGGFHLPA